MPRQCVLWVLAAALAASPVTASARPPARHVHGHGHAHSVRHTASRRVGGARPVAGTSDVGDVHHAYTVTPDVAPTGVGFRLAPSVVGSVGYHRRPQVRPLAPEPMSGPEPSRFDKPDSAVGLSISHPF